MHNKNLFVGAGGPDTPTTTEDNLKSEDIVEFALAISEGPIRGLENGAKSFMVGDTPLVNQAGVRNFDKFAIGIHPGYPEGTARPLLLKLGGVTSSTEVGVQLLKDTPVTRQALGALRGTIDQLEVRIEVARLMRVEDDGGTFNNSALFSLEYKQSSSPTWLPFVDENPVVTLWGKTSTGYTKEFRVDVPRITDDDWDIRISKISPDNDEDNVVELGWESFQCTNKTKLTYADTAIAHGLGVANGQFSSIPEFSGVYDGLIVRVPSNYNADLRTYDESTPWDGSFKFAWTNNPAWVLYDLITNTRYGFAKHRRYIDANRFMFYEAAKWCDVQVPIPNTTTTRPRYTFNDVISEPRPGMDMLQYVAGSFNAVVWDDLQGQIHLRVDKDDPAVQVFTPESITEEGFNFSFTDITTRANDISVSFTNPELDWVEDRRRIPNVTTSEADIEKFGRIPLDFIAVGCTNVHEAVAKAQVRLLSALTETTLVSFTTARQGALLSLYDVILVADPVMGWAVTGRMTRYDEHHIYFRDAIYIESIKEYTVQVQSQTGLIEIRVIPEEIGHVTQLKTVTALPEGLPQYAVFTLEEEGGFGFSKPFRVIGIEEVDGSPYVYRITAMEINRNKYLLSESGTPIAEPIYSYKQPVRPGSPTNFTADSGNNHVIVTPTGEVIARIYCTWRKPFNALVKNYELQYRALSDEAWTSISTKQLEAYISPAKAGETYALRVASIDPSNNRSAWTTINNYVARGKTRIPTALTTLSATGGLFQNEVTWSFGANQEDIRKTEIYGGNFDNFNQASLLTDVAYPANRWVHVGLDVGHMIYYWARMVDTSGNPGPFVGPVTATTISDPELIKKILDGAITETELFKDLRDRINLIDAEGTGLVDKVQALVTVYGDTASAAASAVSAAQSAAAALEAEVASALASVAAEDWAVSSQESKLASESANQNAQIAASAASTHSDTARTAATESAAAASASNTSKLAAESAKEGAQTAATASNTAAGQASTYASDAAAASSAANTSKLAAESAKTAAQTSATAANTSAGTASTHATNAAASAAASQESRLAAEAAVNSAGASGEAAEAAIEAKDIAVAKASEASQSATAASTHANTASTKAGQASTSATNAATSESNAAGSANTASTAAQNAATSAGTAGTKADAASGSASTASTHASNASSSATAANASKLAAESASSAAAGSASAAATSASTASTKANEAGQSATSASSSANTASGYAGDALSYRNSSAQYASNAQGYASVSAQDYSAVNARLNNVSGTGLTIEQRMTAVADSASGFSGQYTVKIDNNGYVTGYGLASSAPNGVPTSSFIINAANFAVVAPGQNPLVMFTVGSLGIGFAGNLNGPSGTLGVITAATIQSAASGQRFKLTQKGMALYDPANNLRAFFGEE